MKVAAGECVGDLGQIFERRGDAHALGRLPRRVAEYVFEIFVKRGVAEAAPHLDANSARQQASFFGIERAPSFGKLAKSAVDNGPLIRLDDEIRLLHAQVLTRRFWGRWDAPPTTDGVFAAFSTESRVIAVQRSMERVRRRINSRSTCLIESDNFSVKRNRHQTMTLTLERSPRRSRGGAVTPDGRPAGIGLVERGARTHEPALLEDRFKVGFRKKANASTRPRTIAAQIATRRCHS